LYKQNDINTLFSFIIKSKQCWVSVSFLPKKKKKLNNTFHPYYF
jgi:hypothetical protein